MSSQQNFTPLLERHLPILRYDSQEPYFADSAAEWTDNPVNVLRRADGSQIASVTGAGADLSLGFLQHPRYANGAEALNTDRIVDASDDYEVQARALHAKAQYANRTYGHWATGSDGRVWLAYWFFYFYNDFNLVGDLLPAGLHEGDWEMIQLRLDPTGQTPDLAVYAKHNYAEQRKWADVEREGERPIVYPARGSHASYFNAGVHFTGTWWEHADGGRPGPELALEVIRDGEVPDAWATWPGMWGGTEPKHDDPLEDSSPRGPGHHAQWTNPETLLAKVPIHRLEDLAATAPQPAQAPKIELERDGETLLVRYTTSEPGAARLIAAVAPSGEAVPATVYRSSITQQTGTVRIEGALPGSRRYEVHVSVAASDGHASASAAAEI